MGIISYESDIFEQTDMDVRASNFSKHSLEALSYLDLMSEAHCNIPPNPQYGRYNNLWTNVRIIGSSLESER